MPTHHRVHIRTLILESCNGVCECTNLALGQPQRDDVQSK